VQNSNAAITLILIGIMATSLIGQGLLNKDEEKDSIGKQVLPKDSFPVLNNP
jgi:hypothetical protein